MCVCVCVFYWLSRLSSSHRQCIHHSMPTERKRAVIQPYVIPFPFGLFTQNKDSDQPSVSKDCYILVYAACHSAMVTQRELFQSVLTFRCRVSCLGIMTLITPGCKPVKCSFVCHDLVTYLAN